MEKWHEENYRVIFGSQMELLEQVNQAGGSLPMPKVHEAFAKAQAAWPNLHGGVTVDLWLRFLVITNMLALDAATGTVRITEKGRAFLRYRVDKQFPPKEY